MKEAMATGDVVADPLEDGTSGSLQNPSTGKEFGQRTLRSLKRGLGRLWKRHRGNASITEYDPCYKVAYLGNVLTGWAKGEGCVEKPVSTLWRNYVSSSRPDVSMRLTVTNGGLTATTKDHGLTEYWAHRVTYCTAPASHPRLFVWVYRHEGRRLRPELRCHAALCSKESTARRLASTLNARLHQALLEFRRDKVSRQNARLSLANAVYENPSLPRRKILLSTGGQNYRPPLERSKSAPKLSAIEEDTVAEEIEQKRLLEELRSLESVASWEQDGWRLSRLLDVLNRESSDENGSISSGCETSSTANSEERNPSSSEESHIASEDPRKRKVFFADDDVIIGSGPRRNSDGSPNFMTCAGSPRFRRTSRKSFSSRSEGEESMESMEEEEEEEGSNLFEFDDEDFDEVDYRPRGEHPLRLENLQKGEKYPGRCKELEEETFLILDSLDEEADSDEGYVEAPPKLIDQDGTKLNKLDQDDSSVIKLDQDGDSLNRKEITDPLEVQRELLRTESTDEDSSPEIKSNGQSHFSSSNSTPRERGKEEELDLNSNGVKKCPKVKENERQDFIQIQCPISETIKKFSATLKSSKSLDISNKSCLKVLKSSKSFESSKTLEFESESPSLHQRKQLLAKQGVTV
ncbi:uncharacterized protein LOC117178966 isoform X2 [Belonocnema kinseyi]|uniref:uncharacterized protein LOC117178966 isoform X2 n=1 Tax=Belonocnema kinseyi TaxID=2817044 RepID=UPI00143D6DC3|nr:uncharacterized protein LOC117178966 isoform X2 [Belonocnema kinseyi]